MLGVQLNLKCGLAPVLRFCDPIRFECGAPSCRLRSAAVTYDSDVSVNIPESRKQAATGPFVKSKRAAAAAVLRTHLKKQHDLFIMPPEERASPCVERCYLCLILQTMTESY